MPPDPSPLLAVATGYWASQALFAGVRLGVFSALEGRSDAPNLAAATGLAVDPAKRLLDALVAVGLLKKSKEMYSNTRLAQTYLVPNSPDYMGDHFLQWQRFSYPLHARLIGALRSGGPIGPIDWMGTGYIGFSPGQSAFFTRAMHALSASPARVLSQRFNFGRYEQLVDIGGGSGAFAIAAVTAWNNLRAVIIDTDVVCRVAKRFIVKAGLSDRISTHSGNMFKAQYPAGDVHLYASIFHNFSDAKCLTLLHKSHSALPKGGAVIIGEFVLDSPGGTPRFPALLNLELLLRTDQGSARSQRQYADWLKKAGFAKVTAVHVLNSFCAVSGVKVTGEPARAKVNEGGRNWVPS